MRIIRLLITFTLVIGVVGGLGWLAGREVLLLWAASSLRSSAQVLRQAAAHPAGYIATCRQNGSSDLDGSVISRYQLRFTSDTEYILEIVCSQFQSTPLVIGDGKLPPFVTKIPGSSGILWGDALSGVGLTVWGRSRAVVVEGRQSFYEEGDSPLGVGPVTTCGGYGFNCCQEETNLGTGEQLTAVTDCPRSCFSSCQARPVVLSLRADPFMDPNTKTVTTQPGESVTFSYVASSPGDLPVTATIEFGDGQQEEITGTVGSTSHTYTCSTGRCEYTMQISLTNQAGITAASTPITTMQVVVN